MNDGKTSSNTYIFFNGNCREAMNFYKNALNGELEMMPFEGSPMDVPEDYKNKVMHSTLKFGDNAVVMASDSMPNQPTEAGNNFSVSIACNDAEQAEQYFNKLADGGTVIMPFDNTFWGAKFGMLKDQFGICWMVNCELSQN